jgi:hypothetical protein
MYKILYVSCKAQQLTLVESSWFAFKDFVSCVVYFGLWHDVTLCLGNFLVVLVTTWYVHKCIVWKSCLCLCFSPFFALALKIFSLYKSLFPAFSTMSSIPVSFFLISKSSKLNLELPFFLLTSGWENFI